MIYITGDVHCPHDVHKLTTKAWPHQKALTKDDYLIIAGDVGIVWDGSNEDKYWQKWFNDKPFTTVWCDGNHSNHELLKEFPVVDWHGGKAHQIQDSVFHLMRGEIFDIEGFSWFVLGGANSHDKYLRTAGKDWWPSEVPTRDEIENAEKNLKRVNYNVDCILTHEAPEYVKKLIGGYDYDDYSGFLDKEILNRVHASYWFCGHLHQDLHFRIIKSALTKRVLEHQKGVLQEEPGYILDLFVLYDDILDFAVVKNSGSMF